MTFSHKVSAVIWTTYLFTSIYLCSQSEHLSWWAVFIPIIVLCFNSWVNCFWDILLEDRERVKNLLGDKWDEYKDLFDDDNKDNKEEK